MSRRNPRQKGPGCSVKDLECRIDTARDPRGLDWSPVCFGGPIGLLSLSHTRIH